MVDLSKRRLFARKAVDDGVLRLPWLADRILFTEQCTRCGRCVAQCETQVIIKGDGGFPTVDFSIAECTFCYRCAEVCPEPLFTAKETQPWPAKASIDDACLAYHKVECRSCGERCEPMAIQFKLEIGKAAQPQLNLDDCNGCGACVSVCPSSSISVSLRE